MSAVLKIIGFLLILFAGYSLFTMFQAQIFSEVAQTQTPDFLDFFFEVATPQITQSMIVWGIVYGIVFIIGLALLTR
jgi:hypothetical protein